MTTAVLYIDDIRVLPANRSTSLTSASRVMPKLGFSNFELNTVAGAVNAVDVEVATSEEIELNQGSEQELFGKLIMKPRAKDLGFILADSTFDVNIWNTSRKSLRLDSITNTDPDSISVLNGASAATLQRQTAINYTVKVLAAGKTTVNETLAWLFGGVAANAAVLNITGTRLVVFPVAPNWDNLIDEEITTLSSLLTSYNGKEQRAQLREIPERSISFTVTTLDDRDVSYVDSLLWGWQSRIFGVPIWHDATTANAAMATGDTFVQVSTSGLEFEAGGFGIVWRDQYTYEILQISDVSATGLTLAYPLAGSFAKDGTSVIPVKFGRLEDSVDHTHDTSAVGDIPLTFTLEIM